jgi:hypothetical protein
LSEFVPNTLFAWRRIIKAFPKNRQLRVDIPRCMAQSKETVASPKKSAVIV